MAAEQTITLEDYTEKSIVVRGNTKPYKDVFNELGGKWNANLKDGTQGWIFGKYNRSKVQKAIDEINGGKVEAKIYKPYKKDDEPMVSMKTHMDLVSRVERLEAALSKLDIIKEKIPKIIIEDEEEDDDDKIEKKESVFRKKK